MSDHPRPPAGLSASEKIARFVAGFDPAQVSPHGRHTIARAFYDTVVAGIAGTSEPASRTVRAYALAQVPAAQGSAAWCGGLRLPAEYAALVNGTMAHALDYDDVASPLRGHASVAMVPALLALGERLAAPGRRLVDAYAVGFEVSVRIARAIVDDHYAKGWHSTASIAIFGATAACAWLLGLDAARTANALGIAVSQAAGTRQNFGTIAKPLQAGLTNAAALRAVLLAQAGADASARALDGAHGYAALYCDGQDLHGELDQLGTLPLEIERSGIEVKKYPLCYATHRALDGVLDLRAAHGLALADVERVDVRTNYRATVPLIHHRPQTGLEAKFSMEYAVAAALRDGAVGLSSFADARVLRPELQAFFSCVHVAEGEPPLFPRWTELDLHLRDGRLLQQRVELLRGSAEAPLTDEELAAKGADCCRYGGSTIDGEALFRHFLRMDQLDAVALMAVLSADPGGARAGAQDRAIAA